MKYSFNQLNYRFYRLIRNISLHVDFNQFCQIILSNPEIKHKIISLNNFKPIFGVNNIISIRIMNLIIVQYQYIQFPTLESDIH